MTWLSWIILFIALALIVAIALGKAAKKGDDDFDQFNPC